MSSDWTTDPAEIPPDGQRQDMTLDKIGLAKVGKQDERRQVIVVKTVIDKGEYEGKRISTIFDPIGLSENKRWMEFIYQLSHAPQATAGNLSGYIMPLKEEEKTARFSALVHVEAFEDEKRRGVKYQLSSFKSPESDEADLHLRKEPTQFKRQI